jgi:hypothetical protein
MATPRLVDSDEVIALLCADYRPGWAGLQPVFSRRGYDLTGNTSGIRPECRTPRPDSA